MRKKKKERYIENKLRASENMAKKPLEIKRYNRKHEERKERKKFKAKSKSDDEYGNYENYDSEPESD